MTAHRFHSSFDRLIALWILRAFSPALGRSHFLSGNNYRDRDIAEFLGLPLELDETTSKEIPKMLDDLLSKLESHRSVNLSFQAKNNFKRFGASLGLDQTERSILEFFACLETESVLTDTHRVIGKIINADLPKFLSKILDIPKASISKALSTPARLLKCGLLKQQNHGRDHTPLSFHSSDLASQLLGERYNPNTILRFFGVIKPPVAELGLEDFAHLKSSLDLLIPYLRVLKESPKSGVNILLHGAPGTGKTQLVRVLAKTLNIPGFELSTSDRDGDPLGDHQRLSVMNLAQSYFNSQMTLLVFDEAEDILTSTMMSRGMANSHKGWFNQMLENNRQPVFWISNSINSLDPAFSRRFDFVLEVPIPPKAQRLKILTKEAGKLVSPQLIQQLASVEQLAPAVVTRARNVIRAIRRDIPKGTCDSAFSHFIGGVMKAQGHPDPCEEALRVTQPGLYDIGHLNVSADLRQIASNLKQCPNARICLYGPPGTGKTSLGHWIANETDKPIVIRKASDLLSPYHGMTEQKIASTFETAKQDGAILLIDEVDSFLRNRENTTRSWEVTQINEMLTQIESFPGILIASTNLIGQLDPASMRRFDIKLHLGYLLPKQAARLLASYCQSLSLPTPASSDLALAESAELSTPGDFGAIARQHRFQPFKDARGFMEAVLAESDMKTGCSRRIGFQ